MKSFQPQLQPQQLVRFTNLHYNQRNSNNDDSAEIEAGNNSNSNTMSSHKSGSSPFRQSSLGGKIGAHNQQPSKAEEQELLAANYRDSNVNANATSTTVAAMVSQTGFNNRNLVVASNNNAHRNSHT